MINSYSSSWQWVQEYMYQIDERFRMKMEDISVANILITGQLEVIALS